LCAKLSCIAGWERLPLMANAGLKYVEVPLPSAEDLVAASAKLRDTGLAAGSVQVRMDVRSDDGIAGLEGAFARVAALGASVVFTSVHADDADRGGAYRRLRRVGDLAARHGITVAIETHPNLAQNGDVARQTIEAVGHPNVRVNYDTANVYYYNHGVDTVAELKKVLPYVAAIHLKDTAGGFETFEFPPLGEGIVDFPAILRLLGEAGFAGPVTLEIEGLRDAGADPEAAFARALRTSLKYLAGIGVTP